MKHIDVSGMVWIQFHQVDCQTGYQAWNSRTDELHIACFRGLQGFRKVIIRVRKKTRRTASNEVLESVTT
ncbi:hypothetical protein [uncultured Methanolobus sp.]|uniref:hypothetical protein n=1 Tax=uncultured Methanolobus sp. TaxID=218300 RepID=UPI0029C80C73|nr:hypothetical protein [uncultured Methanolobus sp.]